MMFASTRARDWLLRSSGFLSAVVAMVVQHHPERREATVGGDAEDLQLASCLCAVCNVLRGVQEDERALDTVLEELMVEKVVRTAVVCVG